MKRDVCASGHLSNLPHLQSFSPGYVLALDLCQLHRFQTPTLNFCVERHQAIISFQPEPFWSVRPHVSKAGTKLDLEWDRGRLFDQDIAQVYAAMVGAVCKWCCCGYKD